MKITKELTAKMREAVVAYLSEVESATRSEVLDGATARLGLSERQMQDRNAWGTYYTLRSYIGGILDSLAQEGSVACRDHRYVLTEDEVEAFLHRCPHVCGQHLFPPRYPYLLQ